MVPTLTGGLYSQAIPAKYQIHYNIFQEERTIQFMTQINDLQVEPTIQEVEKRVKQNRRNEVIQLYDSLDERRQRLLLVHIRALSGKSHKPVSC